MRCEALLFLSSQPFALLDQYGHTFKNQVSKSRPSVKFNDFFFNYIDYKVFAGPY